jgi:hypothetical protein
VTTFPFVSRQGWGADPLVTPADAIATPTRYVWLHHTGGNPAPGQDVPSYLRGLQHAAIHAGKGYVDLEYTRIRDKAGIGYQSRGFGRNTGAQNGDNGPDNNAVSHALCAVGNYEIDHPTNQLLEALAQDVVELYRANMIVAPVITGPHKAAPGCSTACCGKNLIACIPGINHQAATLLGQPAPTPGDDDVPKDKDTVDVYVGPDGAWALEYDGGVRTLHGDAFYGSYLGLPPDVRNDPARRFLTICAPIDGLPNGYSLVSLHHEPYTFHKRQ